MYGAKVEHSGKKRRPHVKIKLQERKLRPQHEDNLEIRGNKRKASKKFECA